MSCLVDAAISGHCNLRHITTIVFYTSTTTAGCSYPTEIIFDAADLSIGCCLTAGFSNLRAFCVSLNKVEAQCLLPKVKDSEVCQAIFQKHAQEGFNRRHFELSE